MEELRKELIEYDKWCETLPFNDVKLTSEELVDKYLSINGQNEPSQGTLSENKEVKVGCKKGKLCHCTWITQKTNCPFNRKP